MFLRIDQLLGKSETDTILGLAAEGAFADGRGSAGAHLHSAKHNEQLVPNQLHTPQIQKVVRQALDRSAAFQYYALPKRILSPRVCRYREGMGYGDHFDSPVMPSGPDEVLRTDLSMTIFLTEPASYEGGELCFDTPFGAMKVKLAAGSAIVYATTVRHRVEPVTRGTRTVVITWIQSLVKDPAQREIVGDLYRAQDRVREALPGSEIFDLLLKIKTNAMRAFVDV